MLAEILDIPVFHAMDENEQNITQLVDRMLCENHTIMEVANACQSYLMTLMALIGTNEVKSLLVVDVFKRETSKYITEDLVGKHSGEYEYVLTSFPRVACIVDKIRKYKEDIYLYRFVVRGGEDSEIRLGKPADIAKTVVNTLIWTPISESNGAIMRGHLIPV